MGELINDEFTELPISRQRKYQLRKLRDSCCTQCGKPVVEGYLCQEHLEQNRVINRNNFRGREGISLDTPLIGIGRKRTHFPYND